MKLVHPAHGQKLDVAGLNEITVLIDRSETALTEVAMNSWSPGLDGPPHAHDRKEQNFLVTAGRGEVVIGAEKYPATPGGFFYVPAGVVHQTINTCPNERLDYFLFNAFLDTDKEGHASFAEHIDSVKATRREQADRQQANLSEKPEVRPTYSRRGKHVTLPSVDSSSPVVLIPRSETERCEAIAWRLAAGEGVTIAADSTKEQTLFVADGSGSIRINTERAEIQKGHTLLLTPGQICILQPGPNGLLVISFGTVLVR
jgi:quercetin dioxygenase-like cupin family protein